MFPKQINHFAVNVHDISATGIIHGEILLLDIQINGNPEIDEALLHLEGAGHQYLDEFTHFSRAIHSLCNKLLAGIPKLHDSIIGGSTEYICPVYISR